MAEDDLCVQITSKQQQKRQVSWRGATLEIPTLGGFQGCNVGWCPTVAKSMTSGDDEITRVRWRYNEKLLEGVTLTHKNPKDR